MLNLGHTIGHAVEKLMDFKTLAWPVCCDRAYCSTKISLNRGLLTEKNISRSYRVESYRLQHYIEDCMRGDILAATKKDKKMEQGQIKICSYEGH